MTAEKICIICGADCAARPRLKDSKGQYACQACVKSRQRSRQAPKAPAPVATEAPPAIGDGVGFSMDDYLGDAPAAASADPGSHCPNCGAAKAAGAVVCMQCGYDSASGKAISTKVRKAKVKKTRRAPRVSGGTIFGIIALAMLILLPMMATVSQEAAVFAIVAASVWYLVAYLMMVVAAFRDGDTMWGIIGLLFWVPLVNLLTVVFAVYYCIFASERGSWKLNFWAAFFASVIVTIVARMNYADLFAAGAPAGMP